MKNAIFTLTSIVTITISTHAQTAYFSKANDTGVLYSIDLNTRVETNIGTTTFVSVNGLAYDGGDRIYYTPDYGDPSPYHMGYHSISTGTNTVLTGALASISTNGAFWGNTYYHVSYGTDDLIATTIVGDSIQSSSKIMDISGNTTPMNFGDIDFDQNGLLWLSTRNEGVKTLNLQTQVLTHIQDDYVGQIAFDSLGQLYSSIGDEFRKYDPNTGAFSEVSTLVNGPIGDLAIVGAGAVPEPSSTALLGLGALGLITVRRR